MASVCARQRVLRLNGDGSRIHNPSSALEELSKEADQLIAASGVNDHSLLTGVLGQARVRVATDKTSVSVARLRERMNRIADTKIEQLQAAVEAKLASIRYDGAERCEGRQVDLR